MKFIKSKAKAEAKEAKQNLLYNQLCLNIVNDSSAIAVSPSVIRAGSVPVALRIWQHVVSTHAVPNLGKR